MSERPTEYPLQPQSFPWQRYWLPRDIALEELAGGYLPEPSSLWGADYMGQARQLNELHEEPLVFLLGSAGIGKTTALRMAVEANSESVYLDLAEFGNHQDLQAALNGNPKLIDWLAGSDRLTLYLDAADESRMSLRELRGALKGYLQGIEDDLGRLRLRIAMRESSYFSETNQELFKLFSTGQRAAPEYWLAPLRREDVSLAAEQRGLDPQAFLREVSRVEGEPFARVPNTLLLLLSIFKREQRLPESRKELFSQGCLHLCRELNVARRESGQTNAFSAEQRLAVAKRIAAVLIFGNHFGVWTAPDLGDMPDGVAQLSELAGYDEDAGSLRFDIGERALEDCLTTALFTSRGDGLVRFSHRMLAEFLAAQYLEDKGTSIPQVLSLLQHPLDPQGRLVPELHATAAWLAGTNETVFGEIISRDPQIILQGDPSQFSDEQRRLVVERLLLQLGGGDLPGNAVVRLSGGFSRLCHPQLAAQLRPWLVDKAARLSARQTAIELAFHCQQADVCDELLAIALDEEEEVDLRPWAAETIAHLGTAAQKAGLLPLARGETGADPRDELKGAALRALWPEAISLSQLLPLITHPKDVNLIGLYSGFLSLHLASGLRAGDLPAALTWLADFYDPEQDRGYVWEEMAESILLRGCDELDQPSVLDALAPLVHRQYRKTARFGIGAGSAYQRLMNKPATVRRRIMGWLIAQEAIDTSDIQYMCSTTQPFLADEDFDWVYRQYQAAPQPQRAHWLEALSWLVDTGNRRQADQVFVVHEALLVEQEEKGDAIISPFAGMFGPVALDSRIAEWGRKDYERVLEQQSGEARQMERMLPENLVPRIAAHLDDYRAGKTQALAILFDDLAGSRDQGDIHQADPNVVDYPAWSWLGDDLQAAIYDVAIDYLKQTDSQEKEYFYSIHTAGCASLMLLAASAPERLQALDTEVAARWLPHVIFNFSNRFDWFSAAAQRVIELGLECSQTRFLEELPRKLHSEDRSTGDVYFLRRLAHIDVKAVNASLVSELIQGEWQAGSTYTLIAYLLRRRVKEARDYALALLQQPVGGDDLVRRRRLAAAQALLFSAEENNWPAIWEQLETDEDFARLFVRSVAREWSGRLMEVAGRLSAAEIVDLYTLLMDLFPREDAEIETGEDGIVRSWPIERDVAIWRLNLVGELARRGTHEAGECIERLKQDFPHQGYLEDYALEAAERRLIHSWEAPSSVDLLNMLRDMHGRLVRSERELLETVLAALDRYQARLLGKPPEADFLWNREEGRGRKVWPKSENEFSTHIAAFLRDDLQANGMVFGREVEISPPLGGRSGEETDIHVTAVIGSGRAYGAVEVIIEVKGCWHQDVKTAMQTQLVERYLHRNDRTRSGIYLVGHFAAEHWEGGRNNRRCRDLDAFGDQEFFHEQARELSRRGYDIRAVVIDGSIQKK